MKTKAKCWASIACLAFLVACECGTDSNDGDISGSVVQDEALRGASADFIANAGDRVFFGFDKSTLSQESDATLGRQAEWLKKHADRKVLIEGHCDERGSREYNLGLGESRADSASKFLQKKGIGQDRIRVISYGKDRPIPHQGSAEDIHRMNRVAISVIE